MSKVIIRPVQADDLDSLMELSAQTSFGLTTLPHDKPLLKRRIKDSQRGFSRMADKPGGETYLFVMEDLVTGKVVGTAGIVSKVGGFEPFYSYRIVSTLAESKMLKVRKDISALHLVEEHNGPSEIGSLFLAPGARKGANGRLLSLSRFLFIADHRQFFDPVVLAEMRGVIDEKGGSVFWDALGRHFFDIDFPKADALVMKDKQFIADLMPKHPIYIPLLPKVAQDVIGRVHSETVPAIKLLESEGFAFSGMVDIFEAGPIVSCATDEIRTVRESRTSEIYRIVGRPIDSDPFIISNTYSQGYRATAAALAIVPGKGIEIDRETASALDLKKGDAVRIAPLRPGAKLEGLK
ncbi:MAG: arginine/ornithine succinyltransferase subunit [Fibrobacteres bacterium]|nr:arginine/ornithine succinyltransferase subunit [Fibrobacterota bacterium]